MNSFKQGSNPSYFSLGLPSDIYDNFDLSHDYSTFISQNTLQYGTHLTKRIERKKMIITSCNEEGDQKKKSLATCKANCICTHFDWPKI